MEPLFILLALGYLALAPVAFVVAVLALVRARRLRSRLERLEAEQVGLEARLEDAIAARSVREDAVVPAGSEVPAEPGRSPVTAMDVAGPPSVPIPSGSLAAEEPPETPVADIEARRSGPEPPPAPPRPPEPPGPPDVAPEAAGGPPPVTPAPRRPWRSFDWESLVGVKLFSWIAGIALVIAAVSFLRYSIDHGWLSPPVRMAIGLLAGIALLVVCELKAARRYRITADALDGAGVAVLFATFFSAHVLWQLMPVLPAFAGMALVAATAVVLALRRDSLFIALLGLLGGFATPFMLSSALDRPLSLFGYLVILNAGLAWVAYRRGWPLLTALSLAFTTLHQWVWVVRFLDASRVGVALGVFLVFPVLGFAGLVMARVGDASLERRFQRTALVGAMLPLLFAVYLAAVPAYGARYGLLLSFLLMVVAGLAAVAVWRGPQQLHLVGAASTLLVLAVWLSSSYDDAWPGVLVFEALFVLLFLLVPVLARRAGRPLEGLAARSVLAAPLVLFVFPVLVAIEPRCRAPLPVFGSLFALLAVVAGFAVARRQGALHLTAAFFAVAAEAVWSARYLEEGTLLAALAVYGVFALFYLGVPMLARRARRPLEPAGGAAVLLLVSLALLLFVALGAAAQAALWGLALLLVVLNAGLYVEGAAGRAPLLAVAGTVLSWLVLAAWWATADVPAGLVPALVVVAGFAVLSVAGAVLLRSRTAAGGSTGTAGVGGGVHLLLVGHAFLLFVAARPELAVPPWPLLGVMLVLDVAAGVASLAIRRGALFVAALVASVMVLMAFEATAAGEPWPTVATWAGVALGALGLAWWPLARRRLGPAHAGLDVFVGGAAATLLLGQGIALLAAQLPGAPPLALLIGSHLGLVVALLVLGWLRRWLFLAPIAVLPTFAAVVVELAAGAAWGEVMLFAAAAWAPFVLYPLLLGRRAGEDRSSWWAAVLAAVPVFFVVRWAMLEGGLGHVIGALPVAEAVVLSLVLLRLVRVEGARGRDVGRLAVLAGAVLSFLTVAIPLQLQKQWITLGWALEGAALAWLHTRLRHRGLVAASIGLLTAVVVRLVLNPAILVYHARSQVPILNWYLYTYLVAAASCFAAAVALRTEAPLAGVGLLRPVRLLSTYGAVLLFALLNIEIADVFATGPRLRFALDGASLAQDLSYTLGWAVFAIGLLAAGLILGSRLTRGAAIALVAVTVVKAFLHDLPSLGGLYRVASFALLAVSLALVAVALQRFVLKGSAEVEE